MLAIDNFIAEEYYSARQMPACFGATMAASKLSPDAESGEAFMPLISHAPYREHGASRALSPYLYLIFA